MEANLSQAEDPIWFARADPARRRVDLAAVNTLVDEAVRLNISEVARALGGVAQLNPDKTISVTRPEADSIKIFKANPPTIRRPSVLH